MGLFLPGYPLAETLETMKKPYGKEILVVSFDDTEKKTRRWKRRRKTAIYFEDVVDSVGFVYAASFEDFASFCVYDESECPG